MPIGTFSAGIGGLVWHPDSDSYLLLKRSEAKDYAAGAWECVTGRVDQGEGFEQALHREIKEETGLDIKPIFIIGTTRFYRGEARQENELVGIIYCCLPVDGEGVITLEKPAIRMSAEHSQYRWFTASEVRTMISDLHKSERWLLNVLDKAEFIKQHIPSELISFNREYGFELDS